MWIGNCECHSKTECGTLTLRMNEFLVFLATVFGLTIPNKTVTLMVTGDVMPGRMVNVKLQELQDFDYPFQNNLFAGADIVYINLESPVIEKCPKRTDGFRFCGDVRIVPALAKAGVTVANLANNHIGNEGKEGIETTMRLLAENGIKYTYQEPAIIEKRELKFGFLGYDDTLKKADSSEVVKAIKRLSDQVDFVIVQFHWGVEYKTKPSSRQIELAHAAIDAGAELVVGNHPHWIQETEVYKNKFIAYSHGNFLFDQQWSQETQEGVVGVYEFDKAGLQKYSFKPMIIDKSYIPRWATDEESVRIKARTGIQ